MIPKLLRLGIALAQVPENDSHSTIRQFDLQGQNKNNFFNKCVDM